MSQIAIRMAKPSCDFPTGWGEEARGHFVAGETERTLHYRATGVAPGEDTPLQSYWSGTGRGEDTPVQGYERGTGRGEDTPVQGYDRGAGRLEAE